MGFNDDGLGEAMAKSYVEGKARDADTLALDCLVLIRWLAERVQYLEHQTGARPEAFPELPSVFMSGLLPYQRGQSRADTIRNVYEALAWQAQD
jgi:hypothetical protein